MSKNGTKFDVYDNGINENDYYNNNSNINGIENTKIKILPDIFLEHSIGVINYEYNLFGKIPNRISMVIPTKNDFLTYYTVKPRWDEMSMSFMLNFHGRVKLSSKKNFQLVSGDIHSKEGEEEIIMQFGKVEKGVFSLDYNPQRIGVLPAFCLSLSTFASKRLAA